MMSFAEHLRKRFTKYKWLPIKLHYFFMFGTVAGVMPFLPVIGKDLGLNVTAVGLAFTLQPISIFLFKPVFGYLADWFQNIKLLVACLMTGTVISLTFIISIQPIPKTSDFDLYVKPLSINKTEVYRNLSSVFDDTCIRNIFSLHSFSCETFYLNASNSCNITDTNLLKNTKYNCVHNDTHPHTYFKAPKNVQNSSSLSCHILENSNLAEINEVVNSLTECDNIIEACLASNPIINVYSTHQFWTYTGLLVVTVTFYTTAMSLTDVACYDILGEQKENYGRQRLYGTLSTGIVTLFAGYINDFITKNDAKSEYLAGYYIMCAFFIVSMVILANLDLPKSYLSKNIILDLKAVFQSPDVIVFSISVFFIGNFSGLVANYLIWYLRELGANQTLLGLTITFQCLTAEVPFFFVSGWFIKYLGYFNCLTCSFAAFSLRMGLYSLLRNPWLTLPIEILHGFTFAVFYASKTAFASVHALPGTEGTLLGILGGLCDGLGYASGSFLGGLAFDRIGGSQTFLAASILSLFCVPVTFISHFVYKKRLSNYTMCETLSDDI